MKKVMVGILILIPILILVIVAAVSNFLKVKAWIGVEDITLINKATGQEVESLTVMFPSDERVRNFTDYIDIDVKPDYANRYSIEWRISGEVDCMDDGYKKSYEQYLKDYEEIQKPYLAKLEEYEKQIYDLQEENIQATKQLNAQIEAVRQDDELISWEKDLKIEELTAAAELAKQERDAKIEDYKLKRDALVANPPEFDIVAPPATLVDESGNAVSKNNTGKFAVNSYCRFTVVVQVESITKTFLVTAEGYNVESISVVPVGTSDNSVKVGESVRLDAKFHPLSSIVTEMKWTSKNPEVASVDGNGVVTGHSKGTTTITVEANTFDDKNVYISSKYEIEVKDGASKFGTEFSTSKRSFTLEEIGLALDSIDNMSCMGCEVVAGVVNVTADSAKLAKTDGTVITVNICDENDIAIQNADIYDTINGYVFAVSDLTLKLKAVWKDVLKQGEPSGVVWETAISDVVTVENGIVSAKGSGVVEVSATANGKKASLILNVRVKVVSMSLRTSNESLKAGLAQETVFASERYANETLDLKVANSTLIQIIGAPQREDNESEAIYNFRLHEFYRTFNYEIVDGKDYASFANGDDISDLPNRIIFNSENLEGKGKQQITVKVSAKYPRYESETDRTSATVTLNVIYGVEVSTIAELRKAAQEQEVYARQDGNLKPREQAWELFNTVHKGTDKERVDRYRTYNAEYSEKTYAICFASDIAYENNPDGTFLTITDDNSVVVYGDVYGNGKRLSALRNQVRHQDAMLWVAWSNVTVSNLNMRANNLDKDGTLSANDAHGLKGECFQVFAKGYDAYQRNRVLNVTVEYCIIENARRAGQTYNADVTFKGLVIRNIDSVAFYIPCRMQSFVDDDGQWTAYPNYSHINMHNCVFSNCLCTIGSYAYERYTIMPNPGHYADPFGDYETGQGRFVRDDPVANEAFFRENFMAAGINLQLKQTGFLDIYNWQDVKNASILDVGNEELNQAIATMAGKVLAENSAFKNNVYASPEENTSYFHVGLICPGISFDQGIMKEPIYIDITFEDSRFGAPIKTSELKAEGTGAASIGAGILQTMEVHFYGYTTDADITPYSHYEINGDFINKLHS